MQPHSTLCLTTHHVLYCPTQALPRSCGRKRKRRLLRSISSSSLERSISSTKNDNDTETKITEFPSDCLLLILCCLMVDGLVNVAQVSRRFRDECRHESLPQSRTATVPCCTTQQTDSDGANSLQSLLHKLLAMQATGKVARFNKLKLIAHPSLDKLPMKAVRQITSGIQLRDVTALDLSVPSRQASDRFRTTLLKILTNLLPRLQAVDLSHARYEWSVLDHFRWKYPGLEKIAWADAAGCLHLSGLTLPNLRLKELYLDNQAFHIWDSAMFSEDLSDDCIFFNCNHARFERVSLKNAQFYRLGVRLHEKHPLPQSAQVCALYPDPALVSKRLDSRERGSLAGRASRNHLRVMILDSSRRIGCDE